MKGDSVMRAGKRRGGVLAALLAVLVALCAPVVARAGVITTPGEMAEGVNILRTGASGQTFNVADGQALMINSPADGSAIEFSDCTFNLAGGTVKISGNQDGISYNNGETVTKLFVGGNVTFNNCTFVTAEGARKTTTAGYDAAVYFFSGDINLQGCALKAEGYNGQFLGLYGSSGAVTFRDCDISTTNNRNGWSYAMYAGSVLRLLDGSTMKATGASTDGGNINAFYSGDNRTGYDAIFVENSTIDFSDNAAGGFSINNVNIHVKNSAITVNDNKGNACNSGVWYLEGSTLTMRGNRGGHGLSCIGIKATDSTIDIQHNGYAGFYVQSQDSSFANCTVDIACNGEKLLSYSGGDVWLNGHTLTVSDCTSAAQPGAAWLGGVGRTGAVVTPSGSVVAHDLSDHSVDNLKSSCTPVLGAASVALSGQESEHTLLLNPFMTSDYARGNAETSASNNDADLFADDRVTSETDILGAENAKIGALTDAELSHHRYDWDGGEVRTPATTGAYGALAYACVQACDDYVGHAAAHPNSFDCAGTSVYAPLVGVEYRANTGSAEQDAQVSGMPETQDALVYGEAVSEPAGPTRPSDDPLKKWVFTGWYSDAACTQRVDFTAGLTSNWTVVYAGWEQQDVPAEPTSGHFVARKELDGASLEEGQFAFELRDAEGNVVSRVRNAANGAVVFDDITFTEAGTYRYTVSEVNDGQAGVTYDDSVIGVTAQVEVDGDRLVATLTADEELVFTNAYGSHGAGGEKDDGSDVPETGDPTTLAAVASLAAAGTGTGVIASILRRRSR